MTLVRCDLYVHCSIAHFFTITRSTTFSIFATQFWKSISKEKMNKSTGRFNLRTRKSLKNQLKCDSCKRHYFPMEVSDDDDEQTENICCDCDVKRQSKSQPKRQGISIKVEEPDTNFDDQCQKYQPVTTKGNVTCKSRLDYNNMVQIHSIELVKPATVTNSKFIAITSFDDIIWWNNNILLYLVEQLPKWPISKKRYWTANQKRLWTAAKQIGHSETKPTQWKSKRK